jgi:hypothetical protein
MGIVMCKMLPSDKNLKILGIPNRLVFAVIGAILAVGIECLLNWVGALTWEYNWWNLGAPWLIWLIGYLPFFLVSYWVFDMKTIKSKLLTVGIIGAVDIISIIVFMCFLNWI